MEDGPLIICEAGVAHNGSIQRAYDLVYAAHEAGADVVKFQTFRADKLLQRSDPNYDALAKLALPFDAFKKISECCDAVGIEFCSTPGDVECLRFLVEECGVKRIKIGSDDLTNRELVDAAYNTGLPLIVSTGMATMIEIHDALSWIWGKNITLLQCASLYPCPPDLINLRAMNTLKEVFGCPVGYSDHTAHTEACVLAAVLGASVIEKHIMLPNIRCVDEDVSVLPATFAWMVQMIRNAMVMLGDGNKEPSEQERAQIPRLRKGKDGLRGIAF